MSLKKSQASDPAPETLYRSQVQRLVNAVLRKRNHVL